MLLPIGASQYARPRVDPFGLQEIDILKGAAASSLYGENPPGGLVNFVSLKPPSTPVHTVVVEGNSYGNMQGGFDVGGPIDREGHYLYRITADGFDGGTQISHDNASHQFIAPAFTWAPNLDTTWTFLSQYEHDHTGAPVQFLPAYGTLYANPHGTIPLSANLGEPSHDFFDRQQMMAGYLFEHHFDNVWTFRQNLRYAALDTQTQAVIGSSLQSDGVTLSRTNYSLPENAAAFTMDNQAEAKFGTGALLHTLLMGIDYRHATSDFKFSAVAAPAINVFDPIYGNYLPPSLAQPYTGQHQDQTGLYAQDQAKLGGWGLTVSGRHDEVATRTFQYFKGTDSAQTDFAYSGRAALDYLFSFGLAPYIAGSRSFAPNLGTTFEGNAFQPSFGTEYEAGVKYQPNGTNVLLTAAAYTMTQTNVLSADPSHVGFSVQTAEEQVKGLEFEAKASLTDRLDIIGSYTYNDARIAGLTTYTGNRAPQIPLNQAALWADYTMRDGRLAGLGFGAGARYVGNNYGDQANLIYIPSYTLFDAAMHYDLAYLSPAWKGAVFSVNVLNLLNTYYVSTCQTLSQCYVGNGRLVKVSMRYSW
jgi:iron complex outermembrane recepter protein